MPEFSRLVGVVFVFSAGKYAKIFRVIQNLSYAE